MKSSPFRRIWDGSAFSLHPYPAAVKAQVHVAWLCIAMFQTALQAASDRISTVSVTACRALHCPATQTTRYWRLPTPGSPAGSSPTPLPSCARRCMRCCTRTAASNFLALSLCCAKQHWLHLGRRMCASGSRRSSSLAHPSPIRTWSLSQVCPCGQARLNWIISPSWTACHCLQHLG